MYNKENNWLRQYENNVFSQSGEDGVLEKVLNTIPDKNNWAVEFGAWDGILYSNIRNLIVSKNYSAVFIEANSQKYKDLVSNYVDYKNVFTVNKFVGFNDDDNLDTILADTPIPPEFDLLSIDIDGNDYHVWEKVKKYTPKIVIIEFNPTIPNEVSYIQPKDPSINFGNSLRAIVDLAKQKGYSLICTMQYNAIFVRDEYYNLFEINDNSIYEMNKNSKFISYLFHGYNGNIVIEGNSYLNWHGIDLKSRIKQLPKHFRKFPSDFTKCEKFLFNLYKKFKG